MTSASSTPIAGRAGDLAFARRCAQRGEHCSIVGVNNMGKTAVLRALEGAAPGVLTVYVDCNRVLEWTEVGFYELLVRAILDTLPPDAACRPQAQHAHQILVAPTTLLEDAYAFVAALRDIIDCEGRVVLLLDEFDDLLRRLDARVFLNLRGLADQYGNALTYITATSHRLPLLRADVEPFYELFNYRTRYLAPLTTSEAETYTQEFGDQLGVTFDAADIGFIHAQADGHPGLLRALANLLAGLIDQGMTDSSERHREALAAVPHDPNIQGECVAMWNELFDNERDALAAVVAGQEPAEPALSYVRAKHLLHSADRGLQLLCPIFTNFVARERRLQQGDKGGVRVDRERGDVYINGRALPPLTDLEYKLLALLNQRQGQIVDKYQIVEKVWGEAYLDQVDDDRIERLVARVREKIEPDPRQPRFLTTVRGRGYRLKAE
ncbi:MAG: winged helix-turn-helix transcriptional regulator [Anaerolineae bacterium]|nr:winged helix-turn-helix transcriptional regulator [Anaerolineae bacterium]